MKMQIVRDLLRLRGELAQRLAHEPGLEADVRVAHLTLDLGPGHERGDRVDDDDVERARADQHVGDLERLLAGVGLGDVELVDVHADGGRVHRVHRVLGVDVGADATVALGLGDHVHRERGLPGRLRPVDLHDPASGQTTDAEGEVEGQGAGRDRGHPDVALLAELHDRAFAVLLLDLAERHVECLLTFHRVLLGPDPGWVVSCAGGSAVAGTVRMGCDITLEGESHACDPSRTPVR